MQSGLLKKKQIETKRSFMKHTQSQLVPSLQNAPMKYIYGKKIKEK